jgi:hypothetical protein
MSPISQVGQDPTILLYPIETAPKAELGHDPVPLLLYCPDEESWLLMV